VAIAFTACAGRTMDSWSEDKSKVLQSIQHGDQQQRLSSKRLDDLSLQTQELEHRMKALEDRLNRLVRQNQTQVAQIAGVSHGLEKVATRKPPPPRPVRKPPAPKAEEKKEAPKPEMEEKTEKDRYSAAYLALKSGRYENAGAEFERLLKDYPKGEFADQARYWLGESYMARQKLRKAIRAFRKVVKDHPESAKHAAALFSLGKAYEQAGRNADARKAYARLVREHPDSDEYLPATKRIQALKTNK
jgi:tol-pal system protein YbgF